MSDADLDKQRLTPLRRQYLELKKKFPEALLFFRLGDFYETFDDDAKIVSSELQIVLTGRDMGTGGRVPMAGVPYHALETHLAKLMQHGYRVAVCEQMSEPQAGRGLVERQVTRVVTPGTVVEPTMLVDKRNNYLAVLVSDGRRAGLAYVDVSTAEFAVTQMAGPDLDRLMQQELTQLGPSEVVTPTRESKSPAADADTQPSLPGRQTTFEAWHFDLAMARDTLLKHFDVVSLEAFGCAGLPLAIRAAGATIAYLSETQPRAVPQITSLRTYDIGSFMAIDPATRRNLELTETSRGGNERASLVGVLDRTRTAMGGRLLRRWINQPLLDLVKLQARQDAIAELVAEPSTRARIGDTLREFSDLERLVNRISQRLATPRDLIGMRRSLGLIRTLREILLNPGPTGDSVQTTRRAWLAGQLDECPASGN